MTTSNEIARGRLYIDGHWQDADRREPNLNPSDLADVIGDYAWASISQAEQALAAARQALKAWSRSNPQLRSDILRRAAALILERADQLAVIVAREQGKTIKDGRNEAIRAAQIFHYYAGEPLRAPGAFLPSLRDGINIIVDYEPLGVVALITPWNFPMATAAWKIAPALAYANTVVFKPSEVTPGISIALTEILIEAGVPSGVFNLVMGSGAELSDTLIANANGVSFTGATPIGRSVLARSVATMTRVQLELGGKNPLIVLDDANLDLAVQVAYDAAYSVAGQRCTAASRFIVTGAIHDAFIERLAAKVAAVRVGHALDADTEIGPVGTATQLARNLHYVADAQQEGADLLCGGQRLQRTHEGYYFAPALFANTTNAMRLNRDEIFGPVAGVIRVADLDEAIAVAADSEFALSSAICTRSLAAAEQFRRATPTGLVSINASTSGAEFHAPFGGRAPSGFGPTEQGSTAVHFYTEVKTTYLNYDIA